MWKDNVLQSFAIKDDQDCRQWFMDSCFKHLEDLGKDKNKRIYIGPGRDGSSDDKIAIDCKGPDRQCSCGSNSRLLTYAKSQLETTHLLFNAQRHFAIIQFDDIY